MYDNIGLCIYIAQKYLIRTIVADGPTADTGAIMLSLDDVVIDDIGIEDTPVLVYSLWR